MHRQDEHGHFLLTFEVAKLDGLLHTYDISMNHNYEHEVAFLKTYLENFSSLIAPGESPVDSVAADPEELLNSLKLEMMQKVQAADLEKQELVGRLAANKWIHNVALSKEHLKREKAKVDIGEEKAKRVQNMFKYNLALKRANKRASERNDELITLHCRGVIDRIVNGVVQRVGDAEESSAELLEKMLSERARDALHYRELYEGSVRKHAIMTEVGRLKLESAKRNMLAELCCRETLSQLIFTVCDRDRTEMEAARQAESEARRIVGLVVEGLTCSLERNALLVSAESAFAARQKSLLEMQSNREHCKGILQEILDSALSSCARGRDAQHEAASSEGGCNNNVLNDDANAASLLRREQCKNVLLEVINSVVDEDDRKRTAEFEAKVSALAVVPKIEDPNDRSDVSKFIAEGVINQVLTNIEVGAMVRENSRVHIAGVIDQMVTRVERNAMRDTLKMYLDSVRFEKEIARQRRRERKAKKEKEISLHGLLRPNHFFSGASPQADADFLSLSQEQLERNEVLHCLFDMVKDIVQESQTAELREALQLVALTAPPPSRDDEKVEALEEENALLKAARARCMEEIARRGLVNRSAAKIQLAWRSAKEFKVTAALSLQGASRLWLARRAKAASTINLGLRHASVRRIRRSYAYRMTLIAKRERALSASEAKEEKNVLEAAISRSSELSERLELVTKQLHEKEQALADATNLEASSSSSSSSSKDSEAQLRSEGTKQDEEAAKRALDNLKEQYEIKFEKLQREREQLDSEKAAASAAAEKLSERVEALQSEANRRLKDHEDEVQELTLAAATKEKKLEKLARAAADTKEKLECTTTERVELEGKLRSVEAEKVDTKRRLSEALEALQEKEELLLDKMKEIKTANSQLIDSERVNSERAAILKQEERLVKESIAEAVELKSKLSSTQERANQMKADNDELTLRLEKMKVTSDLKGTFDELNHQLQAASAERENAMHTRIQENERVRKRLEDELAAQRAEMEERRRKDVEDMEEKVLNLTAIVTALQKNGEASSKGSAFQDKERAGYRDRGEVEESAAAIIDESYASFTMDDDCLDEVNFGNDAPRGEVMEQLQDALTEKEAEARQRAAEATALKAKHDEMQGQLRKALKKIISLKEKQNQEKKFFSHKLSEQKLQAEEVENQLLEASEKISEMQEEMDMSQSAYLSMEEEKEQEKEQFDKVMSELSKQQKVRRPSKLLYDATMLSEKC